jgi:signal transduction histidine kinase
MPVDPPEPANTTSERTLPIVLSDEEWAGAPPSVRFLSRLVRFADGPASRGARIALAIGFVVGTLILTALLEEVTQQGRFIFATLCVVVVSWLVGFRFAFASAVVLSVAVDFLWLEPQASFTLRSSSGLGSIVPFILVASILAATVEALRELERRSRRQAALLRDRGQRLEESAERAQRSEEAALEAEQHLRRFLTTMSHELRTPLTSIIGYGELLLEGVTGPISEAQRVQLGRIRASASHLLQLINQMLLLSKIEAGKESLHIEAVRIDDVLREAEAHARALIGGKPVEVNVPACERDLVVHTDHLKLRQILLNLVSNAVKYTDAGEIEVSAMPQGEAVEITVRDTGVGIAASDVERIWEAYWQSEESSARRRGGTGLGLSLTKRIATLLGGDVRVSSTAHEGSSFVVTIPMHPPEDAVASTAAGRTATIALGGE